ncbi:MAG: preprotein translocase subunit SecY [Candidatus Dadabacteria bacterium]|nr:MAG: preprotein translocase subunit SecY [Candidatus Dadabacteria bacterium]
MIAGLGEIRKIPELRKRVIFTLLMLAVYRLGVFVSTPGIDVAMIRDMLEKSSQTLFGMINMFSGGSLRNFSIFTLGIMPYISMSIIIQMLTPAIPHLDNLRKEGELGQRVITRYIRQGTIALALFQSLMVSIGLERQGFVLEPGWTFRIVAMITLTAGTAFLMWLGEQITEKGIGNGISMIILAGIVANMLPTFVRTLALVQIGDISAGVLLPVLLFCLATIAFIVFVERAYRKIPIQHSRRGGSKNVIQTQYLPLKVNMSGVIPPIFASAVLVVPATIATFSDNEILLRIRGFITPGTLSYGIIFTVLIFIFSFFYATIVFKPEEVADNLKKQGAFIPSVRPGKDTAEYLYNVLTKLTFWGAIYISLVCLLPQYFYLRMGVGNFAAVFGGTAILIVVGVTLDTAAQIESHIVARNYEAFMSKSAKQRSGRMGALTYARTKILKR